MNKHAIKIQKLNITSKSLEQSMGLKSEMPRIYRDKMSPVLVDLFDEFSVPKSIIKISGLKIELGDFYFEDFENDVGKRLAIELRKVLKKSMGNIAGKTDLSNKVVSLLELKAEMFDFFLLTGTLPASTGIRHEFSIKTLFEELMKASPGVLVVMFKKYKNRNVIRQRLCLQFEEPVLIKFLNVLDSQSAQYIVDYIVDLKQMHHKKPIVRLSNREFEKQIWIMVFTYFFEEKGLTFERKMFLKSLINKFAQKFSVTYSFLLEFLGRSIKSLKQNFIFQSQMPDVINDLLADQTAFEREKERLTSPSKAKQALETIERYLLLGDVPGFNKLEKNKVEKSDYFTSLQLMLEKMSRKQLKDLIIRISGRQEPFKRLLSIFPKSRIARILESDGFDLFVSCGQDIKKAQEQDNFFKTDANTVLDQYWNYVLCFLLFRKGTRFKEISFLKYILLTMSEKFSVPYIGLLSYLHNAPTAAMLALKNAVEREEVLRAKPGDKECFLFSIHDNLDALRFWLNHGLFPWLSQKRMNTPVQLMTTLLSSAPSMVADMLNEIPCSTGLVSRLFELSTEHSLIKLLYTVFRINNTLPGISLNEFQKRVKKHASKSVHRKSYYCRLIEDVVKRKVISPDTLIKIREELTENEPEVVQISDSDISGMDMKVIKSYLIYWLRYGQLPPKTNLSIVKLYERLAETSAVDLRLFLGFIKKEGELAIRLTSLLTVPLMERTISVLYLKDEGYEAMRYAQLLDLAMKRDSIFTKMISYEDILRVTLSILFVENASMPEIVGMMEDILDRITGGNVTPETIEKLVEISQTGSPKLGAKWAFALEKLKDQIIPLESLESRQIVDIFPSDESGLHPISDADINDMDTEVVKLNLLRCLKYGKLPDNVCLSINKLYERILGFSTFHIIRLIDIVKKRNILADRLVQTLTVSLIEKTIRILHKESGDNFACYAKLLGLAMQRGIIQTKEISYTDMLRSIFFILFMENKDQKNRAELVKEILFRISGNNIKLEVIEKLVKTEQTCESGLNTQDVFELEVPNEYVMSCEYGTQVLGKIDCLAKPIAETHNDESNGFNLLFSFLKGETIPGKTPSIDKIFQLFEKVKNAEPDKMAEFIKTHYKQKEIRDQWIDLLPEKMLINFAALILPIHLNSMLSRAELILEAWITCLENETVTCDIKEVKWGFMMDYLARGDFTVFDQREFVNDYLHYLCKVAKAKSINVSETRMREKINEIAKSKGRSAQFLYENAHDEVEKEVIIRSETSEDYTEAIRKPYPAKREAVVQTIFAFLKSKTSANKETDTSEILQNLRDMITTSPGQMLEFIKDHYKNKQIRELWINLLPESTLIHFVHLIQPLKLNIILDCANMVFEGWMRITRLRQKNYNVKKIKWGFILDYLANSNPALFSEGEFIKAYMLYLIEISKREGDHISEILIKEQILENIKIKGSSKRLYNKLLNYEKIKRSNSSFIEFINTVGKAEPDSKVYMPFEAELIEAEEKVKEQKLLAVKNAGLVLLNPFIPLFFERMDIKMVVAGKDSKYVSGEAAIRAAHLLQYIVNEDVHSNEYELALNKILCGIQIATPISRGMDITAKEKDAVESLIKGAISHWTIIGEGTSIDGFRESFLKRDGTLELLENGWKLKVENKAFDMLIDQIPWGFSTIAYSWMEKILNVEWRKT